MKKLDDFANCLHVLIKADFAKADEDEIDELLVLIRDSFIPAFLALEKTLKQKLAEASTI